MKNTRRLKVAIVRTPESRRLVIRSRADSCCSPLSVRWTALASCSRRSAVSTPMADRLASDGAVLTRKEVLKPKRRLVRQVSSDT